MGESTAAGLIPGMGAGRLASAAAGSMVGEESEHAARVAAIPTITKRSKRGNNMMICSLDQRRADSNGTKQLEKCRQALV